MSIEQKGQIQRPQDGPPTGEAKRFDPFAGQGGEPNPGSLKATEKVRVPMEDEKISPKLGAEDQKLYQNKKEARAKISVSDVQLKKPESELSKEKQPLPVEYLEMLR